QVNQKWPNFKLTRKSVCNQRNLQGRLFFRLGNMQLIVWIGIFLAKTNTPPQSESKTPMRERIKQAARDLFIRYGLGEVSYGDIAAKVGTTRANLHYHFGNKSEMIETIFGETFKSVGETYNTIWYSSGHTLDERIRLTQEDSRK